MSAQTGNIEELTKKIESSLDSIRPYLQADGGDVRVNEITAEHVVKLEFVGNCGNCSMSTMTFKGCYQARRP
jgi:Fe-S cluster biogenesis protein NfuA